MTPARARVVADLEALTAELAEIERRTGARFYMMALSSAERKANQRARDREGNKRVSYTFTADQIDRAIQLDFIATEWRDSKTALEMALALIVEEKLGEAD
jgi:hypothetical protein